MKPVEIGTTAGELKLFPPNFIGGLIEAIFTTPNTPGTWCFPPNFIGGLIEAYLRTNSNGDTP